MRIVFMGSPDFAVPSLNALVEAGHDVICAYTQPPRPAGRGKSDQKTTVHQRADELGIEVRTPKSLRNEEEQAKFAALEAEVAIVAAYGLILPRPILEAPKGGCINVHASLLPRWRGAAPIQRAILAGDHVTGVTIMRMERGLDTGPMLATARVPVEDKTSGITIMQMDEGLDTGPMLHRLAVDIRGKTAGQVTQELANLGAQGLLAWLANPSPAVPQPIAGATYAKKIDKAEAQLDFGQTATEVERHVRAFNPAPGAWFEFMAERIKILEAEVVPGSGPPGMVADDHLKIACGERALSPIVVQRAGRSRMHPEELLRGFKIPKGAQLNPKSRANT